jgi:spermidine/putrescine transport system permease protein
MAFLAATADHSKSKARKRGKKTPYLLLAPGMIWLFIFFLAPLFKLFSTATESPGNLIGQFVQTWSFSNYWNAFWESKAQFGRSFLFSFLATFLALAISYPLAYAIAFKSGKWKNTLLVLVVAPFYTSFILRTIAWEQILGNQGPILTIARALHLAGGSSHITASSAAVVAGLTYNFLPFMTLPLYASLERIDPRVLEASGDLYANGWKTFFRVTFPLSAPGVLAGTLLTFIPAAGDYINAEILGNPDTKMIGNVIDAHFFQTTDYPGAAALSIILMVTILILVLFYIRRFGAEELV